MKKTQLCLTAASSQHCPFGSGARRRFIPPRTRHFAAIVSAPAVLPSPCLGGWPRASVHAGTFRLQTAPHRPSLRSPPRPQAPLSPEPRPRRHFPSPGSPCRRARLSPSGPRPPPKWPPGVALRQRAAAGGCRCPEGPAGRGQPALAPALPSSPPPSLTPTAFPSRQPAPDISAVVCQEMQTLLPWFPLCRGT